MFLPIVMAVYYLVPNGAKNIVLLLASLFFYAWGEPVYVVLMILSIVLNYFCGRDIEANADNPKKAKLSLVFALTANILILGFFKYYGFLLDTVNSFLTTDIPYRVLPLPIGISFYTFQAISYVIDIYRKDAKPQKNILYFALYISMFPQLIAGPIVKYSDVEMQLRDRNITMEKFGDGAIYFVRGLAKKVLIANMTGLVFTKVSAITFSEMSVLTAWIGCIAYTFQIYFDFSGYCDVASGICSMLNIELPMNFNSPYKALTVYDFWKRWHITLTRFFRTYIYFPLGGSRKGTLRTYFNIFLIFFVSGIWHGANWTFILWGALHGVAMVLNRIFKKQIDQMHPALSWLATFAFINVTWVYFRAASVSEANLFLRQILHLNLAPIQKAAMDVFVLPEFDFIFQLFHTSRPLLLMAAFFAFALFAILGMKNTNERMNRFKPSAPLSLVTAVLLVWSILSFGGISTFLYINF